MSLSVLREEELVVEELIPGVLEARQAPMHAVGVAPRVSSLLVRQRVPLLLVDAGVRVPAILRELCDVEDGDGKLRLAQDLGDHLHHALLRSRAPVGWVKYRHPLPVAVPLAIPSPVNAPAIFSGSSQMLCLVHGHVE